MSEFSVLLPSDVDCILGRIRLAAEILIVNAHSDLPYGILEDIFVVAYAGRDPSVSVVKESSFMPFTA